MIFMEAITLDHESDERWQEVEEQKLMVRPDKHYRKIFEDAGLKMIRTIRHRKGEQLSDPLQSYALAKDNKRKCQNNKAREL